MTIIKGIDNIIKAFENYDITVELEELEDGSIRGTITGKLKKNKK
ncbi:MAG: hypothetical protein ACRCXE_01440 [Metamycoplasmataceae bacterium]